MDVVKEGAESTLINLKQEQKQLEKKVTDPDTSLGEEYNKETSQ